MATVQSIKNNRFFIKECISGIKRDGLIKFLFEDYPNVQKYSVAVFFQVLTGWLAERLNHKKRPP
jgi:hypothetical protein